MGNEIKVQCDTKLSLPLENILDFQGALKTLSTANYEKLKKQIIENGFSAPIFVWKNDGKFYCLDGTQRRLTLAKLKEAGYKVPDLPCVEIFAKTKLEAKKKLLSYVSQFGKVDKQGLYQYIIEAELDIGDMADFEIPEVNMEEFSQEYFTPVGEVSFPDITDSDKPDIEQITFLLHKDQANEVRRAMDIAKGMGEFGETGNENSNGNAIARVCELFIMNNEKG